MAEFKRWSGSTWVEPTIVRRWSGSSWVDAGFVRRWTGSAWEEVYPLYVPISVSVSPSFTEFSVIGSITFTASVSGGNGNHTYQWSRNNMNFSISPNGSSCHVSWGSPTAGTCVVSCVVNDGVSNDNDSGTVYVGIIE